MAAWSLIPCAAGYLPHLNDRRLALTVTLVLPFCDKKGTILLEGAVDWPEAHYIGGDLDDTTLEFARTNAQR